MRKDTEEAVAIDRDVAGGQQAEATAVDEPSCRGMRVLVAEDTPVNQKLAGALLHILGCASDLAVNGKEAVEKVAQNQYDIVLMDIMMPVMDGLAATEAIRSSGNQTLPIIAVTASVSQEDHDKCLAAGLNDFLPKPIDPQQLKEVLVRWGPAACSPSLTAENEK